MGAQVIACHGAAFCLCRRQPAGDACRATGIPSRQESPTGQLQQGSSCLTLEYLYLTPIHVYLTPIHDPDSPGAFVQDLAHAGYVLEQIRIVNVRLQGQIDLVRQVRLVQGLCKAGQV
jgi:hypothetical protein